MHPHTPYKRPPSRASPYPLREGRPIGAHPWVPGQTSLHCTAGVCPRTGGPARQPHCTPRAPHTTAGGEPGSGADGWPVGSRVRRWGLFGPGRRVARATTTWAHASAPRRGETWARSIKIPQFLAIWGDGHTPQGRPGMCWGDPGCGASGPLSSIFFSTSINKKQKKTDVGFAFFTHRMGRPA